MFGHCTSVHKHPYEVGLCYNFAHFPSSINGSFSFFSVLHTTAHDLIDLTLLLPNYTVTTKHRHSVAKNIDSPWSSPTVKLSPYTTTYYYYPKQLYTSYGRPVEPLFERITPARTHPSAPRYTPPSTPPTPASILTPASSPRLPNATMGGRIYHPPSPQRVALNTALEYCRKANDAELIVMEDYAKHADHCSRCQRPKPSKGLCSRGDALARDISQYIYQKLGHPFSTEDKVLRGEIVRVEVPIWSRRLNGKTYDMQPVKDLLMAVHNGLHISPSSRRNPVVVSQPDRTTSPRVPTERRAEADLVEVRPGGRTADRRERRDADRPPRTSGYSGSRGSLYRSDTVAREIREREMLEPVIVEARPRGKYHNR